MRLITAYLLDGRGHTVDGRRGVSSQPPAPVALGLTDEAAREEEAEGADFNDEELNADAGLDPALDVELEGEEADEEPARTATPTRRALASVDPYAAYMESLRHLPRLDREAEHELAVRYLETHDPALARQLVTANLKLVVKLAHEYSRAYRNLLDLIQEGNVGLVQAVEKYDPNRGVKLSSYAAWWIRAYMLRFILQNSRLVRLGTTATQRKLFFNLRKEKAKLERLGFTATPEALAEAMHVPESEVIEMEQRMMAPDASLDAPVDRDDPTRSRLDLVESGDARPDEAAESDEFRERLRQTLARFGSRLKGRDRDLFSERLMSEEPKTLQELGAQFGISRERTRQLEMRLITKLKAFLKSELGDAVAIALGPQALRAAA